MHAHVCQQPRTISHTRAYTFAHETLSFSFSHATKCLFSLSNLIDYPCILRWYFSHHLTNFLTPSSVSCHPSNSHQIASTKNARFARWKPPKWMKTRASWMWPIQRDKKTNVTKVEIRMKPSTQILLKRCWICDPILLLFFNPLHSDFSFCVRLFFESKVIPRNQNQKSRSFHSWFVIPK